MAERPQVAPLDQRERATAEAILAVLQPAYAQEAELLGARQFPPLLRTAEDIAADTEFFFGGWLEGRLVGALSVGPDADPRQLCIGTLVVHPAWQRRGVARALMLHLLQHSVDVPLVVATGAANAPALALYRSLGFVDHRQGVVGEEAIPIVQLRRAPGTSPAAVAPATGAP